MDIELRLREIMTAEDPGVQVTEAVMSRVGGQDVPGHSGARVYSISQRRARRSRFVLVGAFVTVAAAAAIVVKHGGWAQKASISDDVTPAATAPDLLARSVFTPAKERVPEVLVAAAKTEVKELREEVAPEHVSMANQSLSDRASAGDGTSVYAPDSELKVGALPGRLLGFLDRGLFPGSVETLRRREISVSQERDGASQNLEQAIKSFVAFQPESVGMKTMVSCGVSLCEVQLEEPAPGAKGAAQTALNIKILSAFSYELERGPSTYEIKDTHPYVVSYWMRASVPVKSVSTTIAASQGADLASVSMDVTSARNMNDTERERNLLEHGTPLQLMTDAHVQYKVLDETFILELQKRHRLVVESPDEPEWARETERKLRETIILSPDGWAFEVNSIVCKRAGCEIQVFVNSNRASRGWSDVQAALRRAIPFPVMLANSQTALNGRELRVAYFLRGDDGPNRAGTP